jgi:DNA-binding LacI/PurR family transcriptional regulator
MRLEFVARAAEVAAKHGYAFLLWTAPDDDLDILQLTQQGRVDGLILMEIKLNDARVEMLKGRNYPFTMIGHCENNDGISFVDLDFEPAIATAVTHLAELGHRQITLFNFSAALQESGYGPAVRSLKGFEQAIASHGIEGIVVTSEPSFQGGYDVMQALLAQHPELSAAVVPQEPPLAGITRALYDAGLRIPDDFSLVTLLSARQAEIMTPALTSIDFPAGEMGRIGAEMLIQQLEGHVDRPIQRLLRADLTIRHSSGPYRPR